jgi:thiaminase/transcriptional activator TenA
MSFTDQLRQVALPIWEEQLAHPFVRGIADGTLPEDKFRHWVLQDYLYLQEFARIFAWGAAKADRLDSMRWFASALHLTLDTEMDLHRQYAARFGISATDLAVQEMWPTTRAYTDFLVRTAADGDLSDLVAALLPCVWGYVHIARQMSDGELPGDDRYAEWIRQYSADEFAAAADWLRSEMDRLSADQDEQKRARLRQLFVLSSRYELQFWEMCWQGESW